MKIPVIMLATIALVSSPGGLRAGVGSTDDMASSIEELRQKRGEARRAPPRIDDGSGGYVETRDRFYVNALYTGALRKGFRKVGFGKIDYIPLQDDHYRVKAAAELRNPRDETLYQFKIDMAFSRRGNRIETVEAQNHYNEPSRGYRDEIEKAVPFLYLVKALPPPPPGQEPSREFEHSGRRVVIRYQKTEKNVEATVYEGDRILAKGFIHPEPQGSFNRLSEIRVPDGDVQINFMITPPDAAGFYRHD